MNFRLEGACISLLGEHRSTNEDNFLFNKKIMPARHKNLKSPLQSSVSTANPVLVAAFDGMGGGACGEVASYLAAETFCRLEKSLATFAVNGADFLASTIQAADTSVKEEANRRQLSYMGSTVAALLFSQENVFVANVGDSKVFRVQEGQMMQISQDHTDADLLRNMGIQKTPVLLQYLGMRETQMPIDPYLARGLIRSQDVFLLCSNGITGVLSPAELCELVLRYPQPEDVVRAVANNVRHRGGADDATIAVLKVR